MPGEFLAFTRYQENQGSLAVVVDQTFTSGGVDLRASLFIDHRSMRKFIFPVLNFHSLSQPQIFFNSEIFPMYGI